MKNKEGFAFRYKSGYGTLPMTEPLSGLCGIGRERRPLSFSVGTPPLFLPNKPSPSRFVRISLVAALFMIGLAAGLCVLVSKNAGLKAAELKTSREVGVAAPFRVAETTGKKRSLRGKNVNNEPSGIALSEDSKVTTNADDQPPARSIQEKEKTTAAPSRVVKTPAKHVKIEETAGQGSAGETKRSKNEESLELSADPKQSPDNQVGWDSRLAFLERLPADEAEEQIKKIIEQNPREGAPYAALARTYMRTGDNQAAMASLQRAMDVEPSNNGYRLSAAVLYDRAGRDAEALSLYRQLPKPLPPAAQKRLDYLAENSAP